MFVVIAAALGLAGIPVGQLVYRLVHSGDEPLNGISIAIRSTLYVWTASVIIVGMALYVLRRSFRLLYGLLEIAVAVAGIYLAFVAAETVVEQMRVKPFPTDTDYGHAFSTVLQAAVALYVLVRGLDNTSGGLPKESRARVWWDWIFAGTG